MNILEAAKEFTRIGTTAGLSKDVVDLLEKKALLMAEKVVDLEKQNAVLVQKSEDLRMKVEELEMKSALLEREKSELQIQCAQLQQQLQQPEVERELTDGEEATLRALMNNAAGMTIEDLADLLGILANVAHHLCDELRDAGLVERIHFRGIHRRVDGQDWGFGLTREGRRWVAKNLI